MAALLPLFVSDTLGMRLLKAQPNGPGIWKKEFDLKGHNGYVQSLVFSPDGKLLAAGDSSGAVRLWEVATGKERALLKAQMGNIYSVAFSPSGEMLATGNLGNRESIVRLWKVSNGAEVAAFKGPQFSVPSVAFSPNGKLLAAAVSSGSFGAVYPAYTVKAWDVSTEKEVFHCDGFSGRGLVLFLPDNRTLAVPRPNGMVGLWDVTTGKKVREFQTLSDSVSGLALKGKGLVVRSGFQTTAMAQGEGLGPDKKTQTSADPKAILLYNLESGKLQTTIQSGETVSLQSLTADGKILLAAGYEEPIASPQTTLRWWDLSTGKQLGSFRGLTGGWCSALSLSPDAQRLAIGSLTDLTLWTWEKAAADK